MVASCFPPLASALAEAVETTIECRVVKVKRQSLKAPRATEGLVISLLMYDAYNLVFLLVRNVVSQGLSSDAKQ